MEDHAGYANRSPVLTDAANEAAVAGYVLRRWNVNCSKDHKLEGAECHLWLSNPQALNGVKNLVLSPGDENAE